MTTNSLRIALTGIDPTADLAATWVRLEQPLPSVLSQYASLRDVYQLWLAAATGKSAQTLRANNCPVEFQGDETHVFLGFYAWPSDHDLNYTLGAAIGTLSERLVVEKQRELSVMVNNQRSIDLPYYMEDLDLEWETPCFDRYGARITAPTIANHHTWLEFSAEVFGALRVKGKAIGSYTICEMVLSRPLTEEEIPEADVAASQIGPRGQYIYTPPATVRLNGYKVENLENTITAIWQAADGSTDTDQLRLEIPQCVKDVLAFCPDMYKTILLWCDKVATRQVYYNSCKDPAEVIAVYDGVDERSYCSRTEVGSGFDPGILR